MRSRRCVGFISFLGLGDLSAQKDSDREPSKVLKKKEVKILSKTNLEEGGIASKMKLRPLMLMTSLSRRTKGSVSVRPLTVVGFVLLKF